MISIDLLDGFADIQNLQDGAEAPWHVQRGRLGDSCNQTNLPVWIQQGVSRCARRAEG